MEEESETSELKECSNCKQVSSRITVYRDADGKINDIWIWCENCDHEIEW
jgi:hypothetical protein